MTTRSDYGPTTIVQVETKAVGLDKTGTDIVRAVEDVLGRSDSSGARFASSTCDALVAGARKDAVADGRKRAAALATAASVKLSDLQSLAEFSGAGNPCDESVDAFASLDDYSSALSPSTPIRSGASPPSPSSDSPSRPERAPNRSVHPGVHGRGTG